jgi:MFS family permease
MTGKTGASTAISSGTTTAIVARPAQTGWKRLAPALRSRNFRLFWLGQLISVIGTSVQVVAEGWLVYDLTQSTFWLGMVGLLGLLPVVPISLAGGLLIDRVPRRKLLVATQTGLLVQAAVFGLLAASGQMRLWQIVLLYFVFGALLAIDHPARRAFLVELVEPDDLANAVALNATVFNFSSLIGYMLAGVMIASVGAGATMLFNALTYLAPITALLLLRVPDLVAESKADSGARLSLLALLSEGGHTLLRQPAILGATGLMAVMGGLAYPVFGLMPAFAGEVLGVDAVGLGILLAAGALGSVLGTAVVAQVGRHRRGRTLAWMGFALPCLVAGFALTRQLWSSSLLLVGIGVGLLILQSLAITLVQMNILDRVRGRVMSIYSLLHAGSDTLGNVVVGSAALVLGLPVALAAGGLLALLFAIALWVLLPAVRQLD